MATQDDVTPSKFSSTKSKILIATVTGISVGIISYFLWNRRKNSTKVHEIQWSDLNLSKIDDTQPIEIKEPQLPENCEFIELSEVKSILQTQSHSENIIIDVRDKTNDYTGGHINNSINISDETFYDSIPDIIKKYNKCQIIIYCMYGARRSVKCVEFYSKAISEVIANYCKESQESFYFMYSVKSPIEEDEKDERVKSAIEEDDSSIHLLYDGKYGWMDENVVKKRIDIECNDELIENLAKQKLNVLKGGYFEFLNNLMGVNECSDNMVNMIEDFDEDKYEQLELKGLFDKKMWYHRNEYFAKSKFIQLKQGNKSARFKLNSSTKDIKHRF